jgi:Transmembrane protein 138
MFVTTFFFFQFTSSFPFRVGMLVIVVREFTFEIIVSISYFLVVAGYRIMYFYPAANCTWLNECISVLTTGDYLYIYDDATLAGVMLLRLTGILYYYTMQRAAVRLCDPKYYIQNEWMQEKMQNQLS